MSRGKGSDRSEKQKRQKIKLRLSAFKAKLKNQIGFLKRSCEDFDNGCSEEAVRIALTLRILFHDTKRQKSLLTHLRAKGIKLVSTCSPIPAALVKQKNLSTGFSLTALKDGVRVPLFRIPGYPVRPRLLMVQDWWNEPVQVDCEEVMTRKRYVLTAAEQDGGAHVDDSIDAVYQSTKDGYFGVNVNSSVRVPLPPDLREAAANEAYPTLRQIGHEVLNSPDLLMIVN